MCKKLEGEMKAQDVTLQFSTIPIPLFDIYSRNVSNYDPNPIVLRRKTLIFSYF